MALSRGWDFRDEDILVPWDPPSRDNLRWWCTEGRLEEGISLALRSPDQMFWSDASNLGWGSTVEDQFASGVWVEGEASLDQPTQVVGRRERPQGSLLLFGRSSCRSLLRQHDRDGVSEEARRDLVYGSEHGSPAHSALGGAVEHHPDASVCSRVLGSEWMLHQDVFSWLRQCWPMTIDLFASSLSHRCSVYFAPVLDPMAAGMDAMLQSWDLLQAYAFPPLAMISLVLAKVRASQSLELTLIAPFGPNVRGFRSC